jgi:hypothetical protein
MPQQISFDEVAQTTPKKPQAISFDEVMDQRSAAARPANPDRSPVQLPGESRPGGDLITRDGQVMLAPRIRPAEEANFGAAFKSNFVEDPDTQRRLVAESLGIDPSRVGMDNGRPVYVDDDGQLRYVSSTGSRIGAAALANAPEAVGAVVGGMSASPVAGSALGVTGARGLKRAAAGVIFDEPQTISGNLRDVATERVLDLAALARCSQERATVGCVGQSTSPLRTSRPQSRRATTSSRRRASMWISRRRAAIAS